MKYKFFVSLAAAFLTAAASLPYQGTVSAEDGELCTITLLDLDGEPFAEVSGKAGDPVDLSQVDTSVLESHIDDYTQIGFSSWSQEPEVFTEDMDIQALYKKMTISLDRSPYATKYNSRKSNISLYGLSVKITALTQTPEKNSRGEFIIDKEILEITDKCVAVPDTAETAFANSNTAQIKVYPVVFDRPILTYEVRLMEDLGDIDLDGYVNASDASAILEYYAAAATGQAPDLPKEVLERYDVDLNDKIDSSDASFCLSYYAAAATGEIPDWNDVIVGSFK
ncbi:MAG: hypothetical protein IJ071_07505 [Ruminococcus sp.]|nr:hypothetical protein [Ruminococcus sp.]